MTGEDEARIGALADTFVVTEDEPVVVSLRVFACDDRNYTFGFDVKYTIHGSEYHLPLGPRESPYRILGAPTRDVWVASRRPDQLSRGDESNLPSVLC